MAGPWEAFQPAPGPWTAFAKPAATFDERFGEMAAPAEQPGLIENALKPITSYPETYAQMNQESRSLMSEGVEQAQKGTLKDAAIGAGKTALGGLGYVT